MNRADFYTIGEASAQINRSVPTLYRWIRTGRIEYTRNPVTGRYMIPKDAAQEAAESVKEWT